MRGNVVAVVVLSIGGTWPSGAAETCGIRAATFADGFEAGAQAPYDPPPESTPLSLSVDTGIDGSTVTSLRTRISGAYTGPANTGIVVGGVIATRTSTRWTASVPLAVGANTIDVKASTLADTPVTRTIRVTRNATGALLSADVATQRFAPARARLDVTAAPDVSVTRVRADFDGDGRLDADLGGASQRANFAYERAGAYTAVVDIDGTRAGTPITQRVRVPVVVEHVGTTRFALCGAFGEMRSRLVARDIEGAARALLPRLRDDFQTFWTSISANLPTLAMALGTIADGTIGSEGSAELLLSQPDPAQPGRYFAFRIAFERDADGVWRIAGM